MPVHKTKNFVFYSREAEFEELGPALAIDIRDRKSGEMVGYMQFAPHEEEPKVLRMEDVWAKESYRLGRVKGESPIMKGMHLAKQWGAENGFTHMERGHRENGTYNRVSIAPRKAPRKGATPFGPSRPRPRSEGPRA